MSYWSNLFNAFVGKAYAEEIDKPLDVNRGASWQSVGGVKPTFDQGSALLAYGVHAYTNAAVSRISADLAALPLKLFKGKGANKVLIEEHPVLELINSPSSDMSGYLFRAQIITDLLLSGNCYILLLGQTEKPVSIIRLHPDETRVVTDEKVGLVAYEHSSSGSVVQYPPDRVLHGKNISYAKGAQQVYGCGATEALSREIDADLNSQKLASEASSKGRPDILIYPKEEGDIWPSEMRRQILDNYTKMAKQGGAMVLSGQCNIQELKLSPREMEFEASRRMARESISALLGCPPTVLGLPSANFATARQQNITFWQNQMKKGKQIEELLTKVAQLFDPAFYFQHDYSGVEALQETRTQQLERVEKHIFNGADPRAAYMAEGLEFPEIKNAETAELELENRLWLEEFSNRLLIEEQPKKKDSKDVVKSFIEQSSDLPILNQPFNPRQQEMSDIKSSVLGQPANWERYAQAHVLINPQREQDAAGYLFLIARRLDLDDPNNAAPEKGELYIFTDLLARAVDLLNGTEGRLPITEEERRAAYKTIELYYDKTDLTPDPLLPVYLTNFNIKQEITNFPMRGDDREISFPNSQYRMFDPDYAEDLKQNWPEIWAAGGNIKGNTQYRRLKPVANRESRKANTPTEKEALKLREAWVARHKQNGDQFKDRDHPINLSTVKGIVAQIKWFAVADIGMTRMKEVIDKLKTKLKTKSFVHTGQWEEFIEKQHSPTERELEKLSRSYLNEAADRYAKRAEEQIQERNVGQLVTRGVIDFSALFAINEEKREFKRKFQKYWNETWQKTGNKAAADVMRRSSKKVEFEFSFNGSETDLLDQAADQVVRARARRVNNLVQSGLLQGLGTAEIAANIQAAGLFQASSARAIARTEATRLINRATVDTYQQLAAVGIQVKKQWLTAGDEKVREVHAELNMQAVETEEYFESSAGAVFSPAEFGDPAEDVNCRCTLIPLVE